MQPTQPLQRSLRRLALTTKQANKGFYKGTGTGSMGSHTKWGGYKIDWAKVRTYKVPDLEGFPVSEENMPLLIKHLTSASSSTSLHLSLNGLSAPLVAVEDV